MKPIVISAWTLLWPRRQIDIQGDRWNKTLNTYPSRRLALAEAKSFESYDETKGKWPRPVKVKISVQP